MIFDLSGVDDRYEDVYTVSSHGLAAVVSRTDRTDYAGLSRQEAVRYLVAHQRVVETVMKDFSTIVPIRFGTVLPGMGQVTALLHQGRALFQAALDRLERKVQMECVVLWNVQQVFGEIGLEEGVLCLKAHIGSRPAEETQAERVILGQLVMARLQQRRAALRDTILPRLKEIAPEMVDNPCMDDSMVLNVALLVDEAGRPALDALLEDLDRQFDGKLCFRRVGPLPPYSFATIEVSVPSFPMIDSARNLLGLPDACDPSHLRHAYYRLAAQCHPDHAPNDPTAELRMAQLTEAYRLLAQYAECQTSRKAEAADQPTCRFARTAVEQTLLIDVRRQDSAGR